MLRKILFALLTFTLGLHAKLNLESEKLSNCQFVIFVPSYNNEKYAIDNLRSVCFQNCSRPYHVVCVNDCSTDKTGILMDEFVKKNHLESKVTIIHNTERVGVVANIYNVVHSLPDHVIIVNCDGDDRLASNDVLLRLEKEYEDPATWLTYGSAWIIPDDRPLDSKQFPDSAYLDKSLRSWQFYCQHLRTFKAWLFKKIKKEDLLYEGKFITVAGDLAYMFPMLELAGPTQRTANHSKYISDILYFYRIDNPIGDARIRRDQQVIMDHYIRAKKPYEPLATYISK